MSNKKYRTLDGLYKALEPIVKDLVGGYQIEKDVDDIAIYCDSYRFETVGGYAITRLLPVLKRANWMVRYSQVKARVELLVWVNDDNF